MQQHKSIHQLTYLVLGLLRTHQGGQQTMTGGILRMSNLNATSHSMLFFKRHIWALKGKQKQQWVCVSGGC